MAFSRKRTVGSLLAAALGPLLVVLVAAVIGQLRPLLVVACVLAVPPLFLLVRGSSSAQRALVAIYDFGLITTRRLRSAAARRPGNTSTSANGVSDSWLMVRAQIERVNVGVLSNADLLRSLTARVVGETDRSNRVERAVTRIEAAVDNLEASVAGQTDRSNRVERAVTRIEAAVNNLEMGVQGQTARILEGSEEILMATGTRIIREHRSALQWTFQQVEALQQLRDLIPVDAPVPSSRGWAASPDLLLVLIELVRRHQPRTIVECGSGLSTLWLALALRDAEIDGRVIALEHDATHHARTRRLLEEHGVTANAEVRHAPLEPVTMSSGSSQPWYELSALFDVDTIDLLFVDGPPADTAALARLPAVPILRGRLASGSVVVLDDLVRSEERATLAEWLTLLPDASVEELKLEKGCAVVRLPHARDDSQPG